jgi:hypothetical protein
MVQHAGLVYGADKWQKFFFGSIHLGILFFAYVAKYQSVYGAVVLLRLELAHENPC